MNKTLNFSAPITIYDFSPGQEIYIENLCKPFIESVAKAYIVIAVFNILYSFTKPILEKYKDKVFHEFKIEDSSAVIQLNMKQILSILDTVFFLLNFFAVGYWLLLNHYDFITGLPVISWFVN